MSAEKTPPGKKRLKDIAIFALVTLCLGIPAAEITLRMTCAYCTWTEKNGQGFVSPYDLREDNWYHVREPNSVTHYDLPEFQYEVKTNSLGFRDIERAADKPPGVFRIIAVGDSFTEGWGARFEQTWVNRLDARLNKQLQPRQIEVMSAGSAGSDPFYGYRVLTDKLLDYHPDWVLLVVNHSDITDILVRGGSERFQPDGTVRGLASPEIPWGYVSSQFVRFILFEGFDYTHSLVKRPQRNRMAEEALGKLEQLLLEYQALAQAQGFRFTLVVHPYAKELERDEYQSLSALIEFAQQHHIDLIDAKFYLHEKLAAQGGKIDEIYWPDDKHLTALGYQYFAEAIEAGLNQHSDWP